MENISENNNFNIKEMIEAKYGLSLNTKELNYIYNLATKKCQLGDHSNALSLFQFLSVYDSGNVLYSKAAAGCLQSLERYEEASQLFQAVYILRPNENNDCLFYMAYCALKQSNRKEAVSLLETFLKRNSDKDLEKKAKILLEVSKKGENS